MKEKNPTITNCIETSATLSLKAIYITPKPSKIRGLRGIFTDLKQVIQLLYSTCVATHSANLLISIGYFIGKSLPSLPLPQLYSPRHSQVP